MKNKFAVIGDIHGCYEALSELYGKIIRHTAEVYSVGDLIDRGPDSKKVIQFCIDNNIKSVKGNHEDILLYTIENPTYKYIPGYLTNLMYYRINGGDKTIKSYLGNTSTSFKKFTKVFKECGHFDFISNLPLTIEFDNYIISHGGIVFLKSLSNVLRNRETPSKLNKVQVIGHTPVAKAIHEPEHYINIDTGYVFGGNMTAVILSGKSGSFLSNQ